MPSRCGVMRRLSPLGSMFVVVILTAPAAAVAQSGRLDCTDFATQEGAQVVFDQDRRNRATLDTNADGRACDDKDQLTEFFAGASLGDVAQTVAAFVAIGTLLAIFVQSRREGVRHSADLILSLDDRYSNERGRRMRKAAAGEFSKLPRRQDEDLRERAKHPRNPEDELLNFFNLVGLLVQRRALDRRMAYSAFYRSVHLHCCAAKKYVRASQKAFPGVWTELSYLHRELHFIATNQGSARSRWPFQRLWWRKVRGEYHGVRKDEAPSDEELKQFLAEPTEPFS